MRRKITGKIAAGKRFAEERPTEKRCLSVLLALAVGFGACSAALTADAKDIDTGSGFQSYGKITYQNGDDVVVIDSEDFKKLADRLDLFKCRVVNQLNSMNTYFTTGDGIPLQTEENIHIVHTGPSGENCVDPKEIDLNALVEGIAASQSVPFGVTAASEENLSAGTAAWVNGTLLLGTGGDNQSYYENGYKEGKKTGALRVSQEVKINGDDKEGFEWYIGDQEYILFTGCAKGVVTSPAPVWRYEGHDFSLCRYTGGSNGFIHVPYMENAAGIPGMAYYLNF